ncbi:hypothetical protein M2271_002064 [Streptomyces sp. LBL]|nr:hypothetical protein [Streptomyces sp. LBL]MDH6624262.1 hypothetical protein [Streptomyces sp. LBL]
MSDVPEPSATASLRTASPEREKGDKKQQDRHKGRNEREDAEDESDEG